MKAPKLKGSFNFNLYEKKILISLNQRLKL